MVAKRKPADGERNAILGYRSQYVVAADRIYESLMAGELQWIRIADPEAGRVDDIQIGTPTEIHAYQVKWSEYARGFTLNRLLVSENGADPSQPCLLRQLSDGWSQLVAQYPDKRVYVHLVSNSYASYSDRLEVENPKPRNVHFQAFLRECWADGAGYDPKGSPPSWSPTISRMQATTEVSGADFDSFATHCAIDLGRKIDESPAGRKNQKQLDDIKTIANFLFESVGGKPRVIQISASKLLEDLGWQKRFEFRFRHEFHVDERLYQPITSTISKLEDKLERFTSGYLAMLGTPGSGKSTTLTQTFRYRIGFRVIRYYAYVADDVSLGRGESISFLHDLVLALHRERVGSPQLTWDESRPQLLEEFSNQLLDLHEDWKKSGTRTLILIDGLDHIDREQNTERSLIADLPLPDSLLEGVVILLGSQTLNLGDLPPGVASHLEDKDRIIEMAPLDRKSVHNFVASAGFKFELTLDQKDEIFQLSGGHPLALSYLVQKLDAAVNPDEIDTHLASSPEYLGHIEDQYVSYWGSLSDDAELRELLALLCRVRGTIDLEKALDWSNNDVVSRLISSAHHYFEKESESRWSFFHNSFRQYLLDRTGRYPLDSEETTRHRKYHKVLADSALDASDDEEWSWEAIYHLWCAGELETLSQVFSQQSLRQQYFAFRPFEDLIEDLTYVLRTARQNYESKLIVRAILIEKELRDREELLEDVDIPNLLYSIFGADKVLQYAFRGRGLQISELAALELSRKFVEGGDRAGASKLFDAAEPLAIISGGERIDNLYHSNVKKVSAWVSVAHHFRPIDEIVDAIDKLEITSEDPAIFDWESSDDFREWMFRELVDTVILGGDEATKSRLRQIVNDRPDNTELTNQINYLIAGDLADGGYSFQEKTQALSEFLNEVKPTELSAGERTWVAELIYRLAGDEDLTKVWLSGIEQPPILDWSVHSSDDGTLGPFTLRIRLSRLLSALSKPCDPVTAIPSSDRERDGGTVIFERMLMLTANVWGQSWRGDLLTPTQVSHELMPAIVLFNRSHSQTNDWHSWSHLRARAPEYFSFLISAAAQHGEQAVAEISNCFEDQWLNEETSKYWPHDWRCRIAHELYSWDHDLEKYTQHLYEIESSVEGYNEVHQQFDILKKLILAWIEAGDTERAASVQRNLVQSSFSIYHDKDTQFEEWTIWLSKYLEDRPSSAAEHVSKFAAGQQTLHEWHRGGHGRSAARRFIEAVTILEPKWSGYLGDWFFDNKGIRALNYLEGVARAALRDSAVPLELIVSVVAHLIVPFQRTVDVELARKLAARSVAGGEEVNDDGQLSELIVSITTKAYPNSRYLWIKSLFEGFEKFHRRPEWLMELVSSYPDTDRDDEYQRRISLKDGSELTEDDVRSRIQRLFRADATDRKCQII